MESDAITQSKSEDHAINDIVGRVRQQLEEKRDRVPPTKLYGCIRLVHDKHRRLNVAAYRPQALYIGVVHELNDDFSNARLKCLDSFLKRSKGRARLRDFLNLIQCSDRSVRDYYHTDLGNRLPAKFLQDAVLIIELFMKDYENDAFILPEPWKMHDIQRDLILVENQLPFFILTAIYNHVAAADNYIKFPLDFLHLTCHFFRRYCSKKESILDIILESRLRHHQPEHFTDLLRALQLPYSPTVDCSSEEMHNVDQEQGECLNNAVFLRDEGVKFKVDKSRTLCDVTFDKKTGELTIPLLIIDESIESFFRNLMAWELHRYYPNETFVCNYVFLMGYLMKSVEDVDLLDRKGIIINHIGSNNEVVALFNSLCRQIKMEKNHYSGLFRKINAYKAVRHHSWIAILKLEYFSSLWKGVATIAAVILLLLTLIQTICSLISLK